MAAVQLRVDELRLEVESDQEVVSALGPVVKEAFERLARRLEGGPLQRFAGAEAIAIERLDASVLPVEELLGERGAERLAEVLYDGLVAQMGELQP